MPEFAAPSWVIPGSVLENARFLAGKVSHCGLCLFDWRASIAYGKDDLPDELGCINLEWHLHLPLDLPWEQGAAASISLELLKKTAFLKPGFVVLHPPSNRNLPETRKLLLDFAREWWQITQVAILLENTADCDVCSLGENFLRQIEFGFCFDVGHFLTGRQSALLENDFIRKARLIHWHAPGGRDRHWPLTKLSVQEKGALTRIPALLLPHTIHMLEIFSWPEIEKSLPVVEEILCSRGAS